MIFLVDLRYILLTLFNDLWFEAAVSVLWDIDFEFAIVAAHLFRFGAIAVIVTRLAIIGTLVVFVAEMIIHFSFHHGFDGSAQ